MTFVVTHAPEERFWAKVDRRGRVECWPWTASTAGNQGYGRIRVGERDVLAHRFAYELLRGPIPEGLDIDHLCRNRRCVNPAHMEPVTRTENTMRGESPNARNARKTHCAKGHPLTPENVYIFPGRSTRQCKPCRREVDRRRRERGR